MWTRLPASFRVKATARLPWKGSCDSAVIEITFTLFFL